MNFSDFGLNPRLLKALSSHGFESPTPVQEKAIPAVLKGQDVMACAQTGTGKTAAFVLPALHRILAGPSGVRGRGPRVLVLTPTRELAQQIADTVRILKGEASLRAGVIVGGVSYGPQYAMLANNLDLLVATPGRLTDHMQEGKVDLSRMEMVVLDEADKMLDMGFLKPVQRILEKINQAAPRPQMLLFSATFTQSVDKFSAAVLQNPARVELAPIRANHTGITQHAVRADGPEHKLALLSKLLEDTSVEQVIVFTATKHGSERLAKKLVLAGHSSAALHGGMKQSARKRTLTQMHDNKVRVLVATDVAARGIDVKGLSHVVNFDLPQVAEDYVHRIGRTGRAGETGVAVSFVAPADVPMLRDIEKLLGKRMALAQVEGLEPQLGVADFERQGAAAPRSRQGQSRPAGRNVAGRKPHQPQAGNHNQQGQDAKPAGNRASQGGFRNESRTSAPRKGFGGNSRRPNRSNSSSRGNSRSFSSRG